MIFHDSRSGIYRQPTGAVPCGERVCLRVRAEGVKNATLRIWWNNAETLYEMEPIARDLYIYELVMPAVPGLLR